MVSSPDPALVEWSRRHGGYDVDRSVLVRTWVRAMHRVAAPLARAGVAADALTAAGVATGVIAARVRSRPMSAGLVAATAVFDGLDGAVAIHRRSPAGASRNGSAYGATLDQLADRTTDVCFSLALARGGAPRWLAGAGLAATMALEIGRTGPLVVTPGERPMRVAYTVLGLLISPTAGAALVLATATLGGWQTRVGPRRFRQRVWSLPATDRLRDDRGRHQH